MQVQKEIVEKLDNIFDIINQAIQNQQRILDTLVQMKFSILNNTFTD